MSTTDHDKHTETTLAKPVSDSKVMTVNTLATTLFGKTRRHLLSLLYSRPSERLYLRQLTTAAGVAVGAAQRELAELTAAGIIRREVEGRQVYFRANSACPVFTELQSILRKTAGGDVVGPSTAAEAPSRSKASGSQPAPARVSPAPNPAFVWMTRR